MLHALLFFCTYMFFGRFNSSLGRWRCHRRQQTCGSDDSSIVPLTELYSLATVVDSMVSGSIAPSALYWSAICRRDSPM